MIAVGGIDIGNSTTEIVVGRLRDGELIPEAHRMISTKGPKGSEASIAAAAAAAIEVERQLGLRCREFAVAPLQPVDTFVSADSEVPLGQHPPVVVDLAADSPTPAGRGHAVGRFVRLGRLGAPPQHESLVVGVGLQDDFAAAARAIQLASNNGLNICGVLCEGDDATLIANRLSLDVPIVDEVDLSSIADGELVALEVAGDQTPRLADPFALCAIFELAHADITDLAIVSRQLAGRSSLALVSRHEVDRVTAPSDGLEKCSGAVNEIGAASDTYAVVLNLVDDGAWVRSGVLRADRTPTASMRSQTPSDPSDALAELLDRPVVARADEPRAAAAGALTTPGCPPDAAVCDLGGGTIDLVVGDRIRFGVGAGELLTVATATVMGWPRGLAELALRSPSFRVQSPHVGHDEHGRRRWLAKPAPANMAGQLCIETEAGLAALGQHLAPEQWYGIRKALKRTVIAVNIERIAEGLRDWPRAVVVAGGVAEDPEVIAMIAERLRPRGTAVGRANVAGRLGPRGAVAWGQALLAVHAEAPLAG